MPKPVLILAGLQESVRGLSAKRRSDVPTLMDWRIWQTTRRLARIQRRFPLSDQFSEPAADGVRVFRT